VEHPLRLSWRSHPHALAQCAEIAADSAMTRQSTWLPSDRVRRRRFGGCLMAEPLLVAECVAAMRARAEMPHRSNRLGIDEQNPEERWKR